MTLRNYLNESGLFLEGTEMLPIISAVNTYCGFNVSKTDKEPIDQIVPYILAKRIQEWNESQYGETGYFVAFIAGLYEILNAQTINNVNNIINQNTPKEIIKKALFGNIAKQLGIKQQILLTRNVWLDEKYWNRMFEILNTGNFTRGQLINDTLNFYDSKNQLMSTVRVKELPKSILKLPLEFIKKIGNWPAPLLYTPAEVTEGLFFQETNQVTLKIGQAQERVYDKYLLGKMSVFRYRQSVDLFSKLKKPQVVTPYIDKNKQKSQLRIYFSDTKDIVVEKLANISVEEYVYVTDEKLGEVLNPIVEKAIFAIECNRIINNKPIIISNVIVQNGQDCIDNLLSGQIKVVDLKNNLPDLLNEYVIKLGRNI